MAVGALGLFGASSGSKATEAAYDWLYLIKEEALSPTDKSLEDLEAEITDWLAD